MPSPIQYPFINGVRQDISSVEMKIICTAPVINQVFFFRSLNYSRTRSRSMVEMNHPDPVAKTRGKNAYKADIEIGLAEYALLVALLGPGYGDVPFMVQVNITEQGFDPQNIQIFGCTVDTDDGAIPNGAEALWKKVELSPLKVLVNGQDDLTVPLIGVPGA
ncbi:MAG: hypothetical protein NVS3B10_00150 [Polyangiales bacterium]